MKHIFFLLFLSIISCKQTHQKNITNKHANKYATHFQIDDHSGYKILRVINAWQGGESFQYVLRRKNEKIPDSLSNYPVIDIPIQNIVVTSTTHLPALEMLGEVDKLIAFPNTKYISSEIFRKRIDEKKIKEIGNGMQVNIEQILLLKPELLMVFSTGNDQKYFNIFQKNNIPVLFNADWTETTPLGRAEWIKVFGILFSKEQQADSIFDRIEQKYIHIKNKLTQQKVKVFQGGHFGDKWFVPGGKSYAARLISDAGGKYLWQKDSHTGSINLNFENVLLKLPQADVWLNPGMTESMSKLSKEIPQVKGFKSFIKNRIFTYNLKKGKTGGVIYFEQSAAHPDQVLEDLYHIFYPSDDAYQFHFYSKLE